MKPDEADQAKEWMLYGPRTVYQRILQCLLGFDTTKAEKVCIGWWSAKKVSHNLNFELRRMRKYVVHRATRLLSKAHRHWEYHWLTTWQVDPDWQQVVPLQP